MNDIPDPVRKLTLKEAFDKLTRPEPEPTPYIPRRGDAVEGLADAQDRPRSDWGSRAERLLEAALDMLRSKGDPLSLINAAETALRIDAGDLPESEMDGYPFPGEAVADRCTCPSDLRARGGFTSRCLATIHDLGGLGGLADAQAAEQPSDAADVL